MLFQGCCSLRLSTDTGTEFMEKIIVLLLHYQLCPLTSFDNLVIIIAHQSSNTTINI